MIAKAGISVAEPLVELIDQQALPGSGIDRDAFWAGFAAILARFEPENRALLAKRDSLQAQIDQWHVARRGRDIDQAEYQSFLRSIGYLVDEPARFEIGSANVDEEIARLAGPQLVVPVLNARFLLNAANARWGSLYDALYGTDALPGTAQGPGYDAERGAQVIAWAKAFLDRAVPLAAGSHQDVTGYSIAGGALTPALADRSAFVGYQGAADNPRAILLRHNGLHIELQLGRDHPIGKGDLAGLQDVVLEAALTTIVDFEDSTAAVDAEDKVAAYANWLALAKGELEATFAKGGRSMTRRLEPERDYVTPDGGRLTLSGRSLLLVRNVGPLMTTPAVCLADGEEAHEGIVDGIVTALIGLHSIDPNNRWVNSRAGSIYIVKPKMHGPEEAAFTNRLFDAIEDLLGLARNTIKIGVMDEERRTSVNLAATIHAVRDRIFFINTGFLDRTGDEIHTSMHAGPMIAKGQIAASEWIAAYESRNVQIGLASGFAGKAQIGKGMWAAPDRMADMLVKKLAHVRAGATTAWVPSPTAATLHATHYHEVDVFARQRELADTPLPGLESLLTIPLSRTHNWSDEEIRNELDNNAQGILGYVVRWIDQGVGCSKVPDINGIGLMEDRATLRISSQHIANWLLHGICTPADVDAALARMAAKVDAQNAGDPLYRPMAGNAATSIAFQTARALIFEGLDQPNGYTEPLLHHYRLEVKQNQAQE
ncbi:MAG: glcB [Alphaproteobacteria bacterium]|nr:glcB [Alphaproteobacteria bacterium]